MSDAWREMTSEPDNHRRWIAVIFYRTEAGQVDVEHHFEELEDLHMLVERGPDWNTIISIDVRLNPRRVLYPNDTVEQARMR